MNCIVLYWLIVLWIYC